MSSSFHQLCSVTISHPYFSNGLLPACAIAPLAPTRALMQSHGLLFKPQAGGFCVFFEDTIDGNTDKASVLTKNLTLAFSFTINDPLFYTYTANLPADGYKNILRFSNLNKNQQVAFDRADELGLVEDGAETAGSIEIALDPALPEKLYIRFVNRAVYWRYLFTGEALKQFKNLAVIDSANQHLFGEAAWQTGQANKSFLSFTSVNPIALTKDARQAFKLVAGYNTATGNFDQQLVAHLPCATAAACHSFVNGTMVADIYVAG